MPSVTKDEGFSVYRVRGGHGDHEWATIAVREWRTDPDPMCAGEKRECGEILIYSSFGRWAHQWGHLGTPFRRWLLTAEFDYVFTKFMGNNLSVFDADGTLRNLFARVIKWRREVRLDRVTARALWDGIEQDIAGSMSEHEFVQKMLDLAPNFERYGSRFDEGVDVHVAQIFLQEPWERTAKKNAPQAVGFWRDLWPVFIEGLRAELEPAKEAATC